MQIKINVKNFIPLYKYKGTRKSANRKTNQKILKKKWKRISTTRKNVLVDFKNLLKTAKQQKKRSTYPKEIAKQEYTRKLINNYLVNQQHEYLDMLQEKGNVLLEREKEIVNKGFSNATKNEFLAENKKIKDQILKNELKEVLQIQQIRRINMNNTDEKAIFDEELAYFQRIQRRPEDIQNELKNAFKKMQKDVVKKDENLKNLLDLSYNTDNMNTVKQHFDDENRQLSQHQIKQRNEDVFSVKSASKFSGKLLEMASSKNTIQQKIQGQQEDEFKFARQGEKVGTNMFLGSPGDVEPKQKIFEKTPPKKENIPFVDVKLTRKMSVDTKKSKPLVTFEEPFFKKNENTQQQIFKPFDFSVNQQKDIQEVQKQMTKKMQQEVSNHPLSDIEKYKRYATPSGKERAHSLSANKKNELQEEAYEEYFEKNVPDDFEQLNFGEKNKELQYLQLLREDFEKEQEMFKNEIPGYPVTETDLSSLQKRANEILKQEYLEEQRQKNLEEQRQKNKTKPKKKKKKKKNVPKEVLDVQQGSKGYWDIGETGETRETRQSRLENFQKQQQIQEELIKNNYDTIEQYAKQEENNDEGKGINDKREGEVLHDGFNIHMLHLFIQLEINMFKKQNNAKYLNIQIIDCIENSEGIVEMSENINLESDIIIFIVLINGHFSTIYFDSQEECLNVFEPLVNKQYRKKLIPVVREIATILSPKETIKVKLNGNKVESDDAEDKNLCGIYALLFVENELAGLSFAQSTEFTVDEKDEILQQTSKADEDGLFDMI